MSELRSPPLYKAGDKVAVVDVGITGLSASILNSAAYGIVLKSPTWREADAYSHVPSWVYYLDCFDSCGNEATFDSGNWFFEAELVKLCS
jgi:hypothetical protein